MKKKKVLLRIIFILFNTIVIAQSSNPPITGMGTSGYIPAFNSTNNLVNSNIYNNLPNGSVLIGTTDDNGTKLRVVGGDAEINGLRIGLGSGNISTNTAIGLNALQNNTTGFTNLAVGSNALKSNTIGAINTAVGELALLSNTIGNFNTAIGRNALPANVSGSGNTGIGYGSLYSNITGYNNSALGGISLYNLTNGDNNIGIGRQVARYISDGITPLTTANNSIIIGSDAKPLADNQTNQIIIGTSAVGLGSNTTVIGNSTTQFGRWNGNLLIGTDVNNGNVLRIVGNSDFTGNISMGTSTPLSGGGTATWLTANGTASYGGGIISSINGVPKAYYYSESGFANVQGATGEGVRLIVNGGASALTVLSNGFVGIGIPNPTNKLDVNGTIHSKEVKVDMLGWPDFVFRKEYTLPSLEEVEKHIREKGHLENIPSEKGVLENGINLGEMNAKLLQKIEELTLYSIDQNKKIDAQAKEIEALKDLVIRVSKLESELARK